MVLGERDETPQGHPLTPESQKTVSNVHKKTEVKSMDHLRIN